MAQTARPDAFATAWPGMKEALAIEDIFDTIISNLSNRNLERLLVTTSELQKLMRSKIKLMRRMFLEPTPDDGPIWVYDIRTTVAGQKIFSTTRLADRTAFRSINYDRPLSRVRYIYPLSYDARYFKVYPYPGPGDTTPGTTMIERTVFRNIHGCLEFTFRLRENDRGPRRITFNPPPRVRNQFFTQPPATAIAVWDEDDVLAHIENSEGITLGELIDTFKQHYHPRGPPAHTMLLVKITLPGLAACLTRHVKASLQEDGYYGTARRDYENEEGILLRKMLDSRARHRVCEQRVDRLRRELSEAIGRKEDEIATRWKLVKRRTTDDLYLIVTMLCLGILGSINVVDDLGVQSVISISMLMGIGAAASSRSGLKSVVMAGGVIALGSLIEEYFGAVSWGFSMVCEAMVVAKEWIW